MRTANWHSLHIKNSSFQWFYVQCIIIFFFSPESIRFQKIFLDMYRKKIASRGSTGLLTPSAFFFFFFGTVGCKARRPLSGLADEYINACRKNTLEDSEVDWPRLKTEGSEVICSSSGSRSLGGDDPLLNPLYYLLVIFVTPCKSEQEEILFVSSFI